MGRIGSWRVALVAGTVVAQLAMVSPASAQPTCITIDADNYLCLEADTNGNLAQEGSLAIVVGDVAVKFYEGVFSDGIVTDYAWISVRVGDVVVTVDKGYRPEGDGFRITVCVTVRADTVCRDVAHP
jgi:hypothetical protein